MMRRREERFFPLCWVNWASRRLFISAHAGVIVNSWYLLFPSVVLLVAAAWRDIATRTLPDPVSILLAGAGILSRVSEGWQAAAVSIAVALILFLLLLLLAVYGLLGGGDVKLAAAVALGLPPAAAWDFIYATMMIGGVLGAIYLVGPRIVPRSRPALGTSPLRRVAAIEAWRLRRRGPVPYGVAIAGGGILMVLSAPGP
jgi:prepilin peptidase CpaA